MQSRLAEFSKTYGQRLREYMMGAAHAPSALDTTAQQTGMPAQVPNQQPIQSALEEPPMDAQSPGSVLADTAAPVGPPQDPVSELEPAKGYSFDQAWADTPDSVKNAQLTKLEEALKRGNQTIDSAYDEMEKQLGTPPDPNRKLSKQEKGMLLMQFGLSMLANSRKGLAAAAGEAGAQTLDSYQQVKRGPAVRYAQQKSALEMARGRDKTELAKTAAIENVRSRESAGGLPGRFTGDDGFVYFYDKDGQVKQAKGEDGKPIRGHVNEGGRGVNDFETKRAAYLEVYGVDRNGQKLTGLARMRAEQDAIEFANDRGSTLDDLDLDIQAERSADDFIRSNADLFRDMTPEQVNEERNRIADERRRRLKKRNRSYLEPNEPTRGKPKRRFVSEADAKSAFDRGEINVGDIIIVNGVEGPVE